MIQPRSTRGLSEPMNFPRFFFLCFLLNNFYFENDSAVIWRRKVVNMILKWVKVVKASLLI